MGKGSLSMAWLILSVTLVLCGCGGGKEAEQVVKPSPFVTAIVAEKRLTFDRWDQGSPQSACSEDVCLVVFTDNREDSTGLNGADIWGVLVAPDLTVVKEFPIARRPGKDESPQVVYDADNRRFGVVWSGFGNGASESVFGALVYPDGTVVGARDLKVAAGYADGLSMRQDGESFVILFRDSWATFDPGVGSRVLKLAVIDRAFNVLRIFTVTNESVDGIRVAPLSSSFDCHAGKCYVAFTMIKNIMRDGSESVYGEYVDLQEGVIGSEGEISDRPSGKAATKTSVSVTYGNGHYLVVWDDWDSPQGYGSTDIRGRFVGAESELSDIVLISDFRWDRGQSLLTGLNGVAGRPSVAYLGSDKGFQVVWEDTRTGVPSDTGIFGRKVDLSWMDDRCVLLNRVCV